MTNSEEVTPKKAGPISAETWNKPIIEAGLRLQFLQMLDAVLADEETLREVVALIRTRLAEIDTTE